MNRMHIHISVNDLAQSVDFYSKLFAAEPTVLEQDYAKWMLEDPRVNFAISQRGERTGLNHLGIQSENEVELAAIKNRLDAVGMSVLTETETTCCYATSDKHWVQDPSGIAWEAYRTLDSAPTFHAGKAETACCVPSAETVSFVPRKQASRG